MKYRTAQQFYQILSYGFVTINYMTKKISMTYQHIWNSIKFLKGLDILDEKISPIDKTQMTYKLKPMTFNEFLEKVNL